MGASWDTGAAGPRKQLGELRRSWLPAPSAPTGHQVGIMVAVQSRGGRLELFRECPRVPSGPGRQGAVCTRRGAPSVSTKPWNWSRF